MMGEATRSSGTSSKGMGGGTLTPSALHAAACSCISRGIARGDTTDRTMPELASSSGTGDQQLVPAIPPAEAGRGRGSPCVTNTTWRTTLLPRHQSPRAAARSPSSSDGPPGPPSKSAPRSHFRSCMGSVVKPVGVHSGAGAPRPRTKSTPNSRALWPAICCTPHSFWMAKHARWSTDQLAPVRSVVSMMKSNWLALVEPVGADWCRAFPRISPFTPSHSQRTNTNEIAHTRRATPRTRSHSLRSHAPRPRTAPHAIV